MKLFENNYVYRRSAKCCLFPIHCIEAVSYVQLAGTIHKWGINKTNNTVGYGTLVGPQDNNRLRPVT